MNSKWSPENKPIADLPYRAPPGLVAAALGHAPRPSNHVVRSRPNNRQAPQRPNQPRPSTSYANAARRRPANDYQRPPQPQQQTTYRRPHNQAAPSATQLSADELAGLRALLQKHK